MPKKTNKSVTRKKQKPAVQFATEKIQNDANLNVSSDTMNLGEITEQMRTVMQSRERNEDTLEKSVKPLRIKRGDFKYDRNKVAFSSKAYEQSYDGISHKGWRRLNDDELRQISQVDPYIAAIISTRCAQGQVIGRASESKFDKGTRIKELDPLKRDDFDDDESFKMAKERRQLQSETILNWMLSCGTEDDTILDTAFEGTDKFFKKCSLSDYLAAQIRNLLTFGRFGGQVFRNSEGPIVFFRPAPVETIQNVIDDREITMSGREESYEQSFKDAQDWNALPDGEKPYAYVQIIEGTKVNFYTEQDFKMAYFQKQALFDLRGYPLAPIETAMYMVFIHQNTLGYLRNQFVKGLGTKGILTLESTDIAGELSPEDLEVLRREFHNFLNRTDNSASTPVISGPVKVGWVPLASTPRDMEFLQVEEHIIRALCAAFQTSPMEMGYGHLSIGGNNGLGQDNKQEEIVRGEERGLRMLLDTVYDHLNEILYENFPEAKKLFRLTYVGVGEDTRDAVVSRNNQELQTTATLGSLYADSEKQEQIPVGGEVPLAPAFHQAVVRFLKYGEFMEKFMGMEEWGNPDKFPQYDFIIDPALDQAYQQLKIMPIPMQQEQSKLQLEEQEMQIQMEEQQMEQGQQQMEMAQQDPAMAMQMQAQGMPPGQEDGQPGQEEQSEDLEQSQSLLDVFIEKNQLRKSLGHYYSEWMKKNEPKL